MMNLCAIILRERQTLEKYLWLSIEFNWGNLHKLSVFLYTKTIKKYMSMSLMVLA